MICIPRVFVLCLLLCLGTPVFSQPPGDHFPLNVGDNWQYLVAHDSSYGFDRWVKIETLADTLIGVPGELLSHHIQRSEKHFQELEFSPYHSDYVSYTETGDIGNTAFNLNGMWVIPSELLVMLFNPLSVGSEVYHENVAGIGLNIRYTVLSLSDTLHLTLGDFENCLRYSMDIYDGDILFETREEVLIPDSYWPICGLGAWSGIHYDYDPYEEREFHARLIACDVQEPTSVPEVAPHSVRLGQNHPNPFNPHTAIPFTLKREREVSLKIYDSLGRSVRTLMANELRSEGIHSLVWDGRDEAGRDMPTGVYLYRLESRAFRDSHRMLLLR